MEHRLRTIVELLVVAPVVAVVFSAIPWAKDSRLESEEQRLIALLTNRRAVVYKEEIDALLTRVDPNLMVGVEPLLVAAGVRRESAEAVRTLIKRGADPNRHDWGCTALLVAIGEVETVSMTGLLLELGANPNLIPTAGERKKSGFIECGSVGMEKRTDLNKEASSPLGLVMYYINFNDRGQSNREEIAKILIKNGGKLHPKEVSAHLPAALEKKGLVWEAILASDPKLDIHLASGETPLGVAVRKKNPDLFLQLIGAGAGPEFADRSGVTPLEIVVSLCVRAKDGLASDVAQARDKELASIASVLVRKVSVPAALRKEASGCSAEVAKLFVEAEAAPNPPSNDR
jgi:hypothetical protein